MPVSEQTFESWCFRNGGETYDEDEGPGIACQFPDTDTEDRVHYLPDNDSFDVITDGASTPLARFISTLNRGSMTTTDYTSTPVRRA